MAKTAIALVPFYHTYYKGVERLYCLNYANSNGELAATRFVYDKQGANTMAFYQEISGNRSSKNFHAFDKAKRIVRKTREFNDGETSVEEFRYDESGKLVEESFSSSSGNAGATQYEYDDEGNAIRMICNAYKGWLTGVIEFEFDQSGKRLKGLIIKDGTPCGTIEYQYGTSGSLIHENWKVGDDQSQTLQFVFEETK